MKGVGIKHFDKFKLSNISMSQFYFNFSYEVDQDAITTATNICIILHFLPSKIFIN